MLKKIIKYYLLFLFNNFYFISLNIGLFLKSPNIKQVSKEKQHNDEVSWEVPE